MGLADSSRPAAPSAPTAAATSKRSKAASSPAPPGNTTRVGGNVSEANKQHSKKQSAPTTRKVKSTLEPSPIMPPPKAPLMESNEVPSPIIAQQQQPPSQPQPRQKVSSSSSSGASAVSRESDTSSKPKKKTGLIMPSFFNLGSRSKTVATPTPPAQRAAPPEVHAAHSKSKVMKKST
jgi:hypothetical protein